LIKMQAAVEKTGQPYLCEALGQLLVDGLQGLAVTAPGGIHLRVATGSTTI
jgi:hypothetical protein